MENIPAISVKKMRELDLMMVEEFGITIPQMMETAGRSTAELAKKLLRGDVNHKKVIAAAGVGNNGGDALVAMRFLTNWGAKTQIILTDATKLHNLPLKQLETVKKMKIPIQEVGSAKNADFQTCDLVIDGIIGYNLKGDPRGKARALIEEINESGKAVLSIDIPSGLDAQTGHIGNPCIKASTTLALSLPKVGSVKPQARSVVGRLYITDMSVPQALYEKLNIKVGMLFSQSSIIEYFKE